MLLLLVRVLNSGEGYAALPSTPYGGHAATRSPFCDDKSPTSQGVPGPMPILAQPSVFDYDNNGGIPPSIPGYPVMQPNRPMMVQPLSRSESMVYPDFSSSPNYAGQLQQHSPMNNHLIGPQSYGSPPMSIAGAPGFSSVVYQGGYPQTAESVEGITQSQGLDIVLTSQKPAQAKRGPFRTNDEREATAETRKIGSCIRCRMQRIRVGISISSASDASNVFVNRKLLTCQPHYPVRDQPAG